MMDNDDNPSPTKRGAGSPNRTSKSPGGRK